MKHEQKFLPVLNAIEKVQPNDLRSWLALTHVRGLGPVTALKLLKRFSSPLAVLRASREQLSAHVSEKIIQALQNPCESMIENSLAWSAREGNCILTWQDALYPPLLREIATPPLVLFVQGDARLLSSPQLAVVGSRHPTPTGLDVAYTLSQDLSRAGLTITSGLALGIDKASHQGALSACGKTLAVLGTGLDAVYPACHKNLAKQILKQGGALISEFPLGTLPRAENFPRRNRIISALSLGVLVIEAAVRSGSLITANYALEQGREVFAVPGSIRNALARGCHALLKQGAKLVEQTQDVLEELKQFSSESAAHSHPSSKMDLQALDCDSKKLVECVGFELTSMDTLIERARLPAEIVSARVLMLEISGYIKAMPGGYVRTCL